MAIQIYDFLDFFEDQHDYFRAVIDHSEIQYTERIPTAAVALENKKIVFKINKEWWEKETPLFIDKCFVIAHEMSHLLFKHLSKIKNTAPKNRPLMNVAMDLFINQLICKFFDISRSTLSPELSENGCWVDTIFPDRNDVEIDRGTDYYYNELLIEAMDAEPSYAEDLLEKLYSVLSGDSDGSLSDKEMQQLQEILENVSEDTGMDIEKSLSSLSEKEIESILQAGSESGRKQSAQLQDVKVKKPWESVIKKWCKNKAKQKRHRGKRWGFTNRKFEEITRASNYLFQGDPSIVVKSKEKEKVSVALFLDTSGSCINLKNRFVSAASSIPSKHFNIHVATFDTSVKKVFDDRDSNSIRGTSSWSIWGGGGTAFNIIEDYLQKLPKYPDAIFVITDGYGNNIFPQHPERFYWFLTKYNSKQYIPYLSKIYQLDNFI